jgi:hypothetical protein
MNGRFNSIADGPLRDLDPPSPRRAGALYSDYPEGIRGNPDYWNLPSPTPGDDIQPIGSHQSGGGEMPRYLRPSDRIFGQWQPLPGYASEIRQDSPLHSAFIHQQPALRPSDMMSGGVIDTHHTSKFDDPGWYNIYDPKNTTSPRVMSDHDRQLAYDLAAVRRRQRVQSPLRWGSPNDAAVTHPYNYHPLQWSSPGEQELVELTRGLSSPTVTPPPHSRQHNNLRWTSQ